MIDSDYRATRLEGLIKADPIILIPELVVRERDNRISGIAWQCDISHHLLQASHYICVDDCNVIFTAILRRISTFRFFLCHARKYSRRSFGIRTSIVWSLIAARDPGQTLAAAQWIARECLSKLRVLLPKIVNVVLAAWFFVLRLKA